MQGGSCLEQWFEVQPLKSLFFPPLHLGEEGFNLPTHYLSIDNESNLNLLMSHSNVLKFSCKNHYFLHVHPFGLAGSIILHLAGKNV